MAEKSNAFFLIFLLTSVILVLIAGTRAILPLAALAPLLVDPLSALFLISLLASAALIHETSNTFVKSTPDDVSKTTGNQALLVAAPTVSVFILIALAKLTPLSGESSTQLFFLACLQSLLTVSAVFLVTKNYINGPSSWWLAPICAPLVAPLIDADFEPIISWLALIGAAFALHLGARSMVTIGSIFGLLSLFFLPPPSALITSVLFILLVAVLLMPTAEKRGVIVLSDVLIWRLSLLFVAGIWVGWSFWVAELPSPALQNVLMLTYVGFLAVISLINRQAIRARKKLQSQIKSAMLIIGQLGRGGAEKQLILLANSLASADIATTLVSFHGGERQSQVSEKVNLVILQERPPERVPWLITITPRLWWVIWRQQPQLLIAFLLYAYLASIPLAAISTNAIRVSSRRSLGMFKDVKWVLHIERLVNALTDLVIANSHAVANYAIKQEALDPQKVKVIQNVLPKVWYTKPLNPLAAGSSDREVTILNVANLIAYKGQQTLIEAIAVVRERFPETTLRIVGDGPERNAITELAAKLEVPLDVTGFSEVDYTTYQSGEIFVLSSNEEGMSNALMEAMAAGLPIVATDVGGNSEVLGDSGLLVPPGNPIELASAIGRLLEDPSLAISLGRSARSRAERLFDADNVGRSYLELIGAGR